MCGDFLQLPVVNNTSFAFESCAWKLCIDTVVYMKEIIRQQNTPFQTALNEIRYGKPSSDSVNLIESRCGIKPDDKKVLPTRIFTTNRMVEEINSQELEKLLDNGADYREYEMEHKRSGRARISSDKIKRYKRNCPAPEELCLCIRAQVMLLTNLDLNEGLANGSRGVVVDFENDLPVVEFLSGYYTTIDWHEWRIEEENKTVLSIYQIPLRLAYAITVHKSQGITLDYAQLDLSNIFDYGMAYVALSRVRNLDGLYIDDICWSSVKAHPRAVQFYKNVSKEPKDDSDSDDILSDSEPEN